MSFLTLEISLVMRYIHLGLCLSYYLLISFEWTSCIYAFLKLLLDFHRSIQTALSFNYSPFLLYVFFILFFPSDSLSGPSIPALPSHLSLGIYSFSRSLSGSSFPPASVCVYSLLINDLTPNIHT